MRKEILEWKMRSRRLFAMILTCVFVAVMTGCGKSSAKGNVKEAENEVEEMEVLPTKNLNKVDYESYFEGLNGCAVFYDMKASKYYIYNEEMCLTQDSPCSTFKIIATLIGAHEKVLTGIYTKMDYDGTDYGSEAWNQNLGLKDAFRASCVWYFRKVIDKVGQEKVQKYVDNLKFGNCDISKWYGNEDRDPEDLNGFWLDSTLKISPLEWVDVLASIWSGKTEFNKQDIDLLKNIMNIQDTIGLVIYGKTGTGKPDKEGKVKNGWYVGKFEVKDRPYFFALHLTEPASEKISGPKAQEITRNIIANEYLEEKE
ncbi:penicillin-binding transpeptidase domain-containing protein [[Clostridium] polysaccharolyticum]|uniref:beta-lactamase n=1 Tax=[Clostridium] polysaccharolyticum TaxID=29364 RepID=A0A1I0ERH0_9FIRM|nr:penicillin-binding transpeptidase domain-containing protein [[Clostridium] polysaccharolyticum]SET47153.1 bla regulator protein blaR1 [[Clostridium] polysaccharolyticum]